MTARTPITLGALLPSVGERDYRRLWLDERASHMDTLAQLIEARRLIEYLSDHRRGVSNGLFADLNSWRSWAERLLVGRTYIRTRHFNYDQVLRDGIEKLITECVSNPKIGGTP